ncbi:MAG TPA: glycosyltransferase family 4 protein [Povalibacter sp.]
MPESNEKPMSSSMRCLWIGRHIPYPLDSGVKVYSAKLAGSLAAAGASVRFLGPGNTDAVPESAAGVEWVAVPNDKRNEILALFSRLPNGAAIDATQAYRALLDEQLEEHWDAIVLDTYAAGWALDRCLTYCRSHERRPVLVHVSHNHETAVWQSMVTRAQTSLPKRFVWWQNALKVRALEERVVRNVDLLAAITDEDVAALIASVRRPLPAPRTVTLTPGYHGTVASPRLIDTNTPRRVVIVGSFHWAPKQENLRQFVQCADEVFARHGIALDIVGEVPESLQTELRARTYATHFHGFVDDPAVALAQARMALVPELIGGGFKLKFLDYLFGRIPVATLGAAAAGLPQTLRDEMLVCDDLQALVDGIVAEMDDFPLLNRRQQNAFELAKTLYRWEDRGQQLNQALTRIHRSFQLRDQQRPGAWKISAPLQTK